MLDLFAGVISSPTEITLTDITADRVFQRSAGETSGPVTVSGTHSGAVAEIQVKVLLDADDSTVVDWVTLDAAPAGGAFSGEVTTPQGGPYYIQVRVADTPEVVLEGGTIFFVGIIVIFYGQSYIGSLFGAGSSTAVAGSIIFNGSAYVASTAAAGRILNGIVNNLGVPACGFNGSHSGVTLDQGLMKGHVNGYYEELMEDVATMGGDFEMVIFIAGSSGISAPAFTDMFSQLHTDLTTDIGRTKAEMPFFLASILRWEPDGPTDEGWVAVQGGILGVEPANTNMWYSHSNMDATQIDGVHSDAASALRTADRFVQTIRVVYGDTTGVPKWFIASAEVIDATTTDVNLEHETGTDFTPTEDITGFSVTGDNGASWEAPSAAERLDATTIRLTHSSLATSSVRKLRYQYGKEPDITAAVHDNSALAAPLNFIVGHMSPVPLSVIPVPTHRSYAADNVDTDTNSFTISDIGVGDGSADLLAIVAVSLYSPGNANRVSSLSSITLDSGAVSELEKILESESSGSVWGTQGWYTFKIPAGATRISELVCSFAGTTFSGYQFSLWTVPYAALSSTTPVDTDITRTADVDTLTATVTTLAGGFLLAHATSLHGASNPCTWDDPGTVLAIAERYDTQHTNHYTGADASDTPLSVLTTIRATFAEVEDMSLGVVTFR